MARPRSLRPSPEALRKRAARAIAGSGASEALAVAEAALGAAVDSPAVPSGASLEESTRLRSVFDARKARIVAQVEELRLAVERGSLRPLAVLREASEVQSDALVRIASDAFIRHARDLLAPAVPTEQQRLITSAAIERLRRAVAAELQTVIDAERKGQLP